MKRKIIIALASSIVAAAYFGAVSAVAAYQYAKDREKVEEEKKENEDE